MMKILHSRRSKRRVSSTFKPASLTPTEFLPDAKAKADLAKIAKGSKGPLNTGSQGIKKSGKK
jgi:hypothetical protein